MGILDRIDGLRPVSPDAMREFLIARCESILAHAKQDDSLGLNQYSVVQHLQRELDSLKGQRDMEQIPTIGRIVHYRLSEDDATQINRRRTTGKSIAERMRVQVSQVETETPILGWPTGAQAHIGNEAHEGDTYPMMITRTWGDTPTSAVNGQCYLDGNDVLWVTSVSVGEGPRTFSWPSRS